MRIVLNNTIKIELEDEDREILKSCSIFLDVNGNIRPQKIDLEPNVMFKKFLRILDEYGYDTFTLSCYNEGRYTIEFPED